jgi:predicted O-methyltransferase YrrM
MGPVRVSDELFRTAVATLRVPEMGTETVASLLADLVRLLRPRRVLEIGMGYTTPFLAAALAEVEEQAYAESRSLARKTGPYLAGGAALDDAWLEADPSLVAPGFFADPYRPELVAVDNLSIGDSSAGRVQEVLRELRLDDRVTVVNADLRECIDQLPEGFRSIDLAWVDAWECLYFFDHFWDLMNPDGGLVVMHYLLTYPEGEAILRYIDRFRAHHPGELEMVNLLEPHKLTQNSITMLRRTGGEKRRRWAETGGRIRYDDALRADAAAHLDSVRSQDAP